MITEQLQQLKEDPQSRREFATHFSVIAAIFLLIIVFSLTAAPSNFPVGKIITIEEGETVKQVAEKLKEEDIVHSASLFSVLVTFSDKAAVEGDYFFHKPINIFEVKRRISSGSYNIPTVDVIFYEGMTVAQIAKRLNDQVPNFDAGTFLTLAEEKEGYLFPDTYKLPQNISPERALAIFTDNFEKQIAEHQDEINASGRSLEEIIIMASIVEREATHDTRQEIADILWSRIDLDMPLQVDAPFVYAVGKGTFDLTLADLKEDHPYNTYKHLGLVPTPISNPGIESILAAANPQETPYLYFLTGSDGTMHFATNFEEHKRNKELYFD
jgi:UPF0755 protein